MNWFFRNFVSGILAALGFPRVFFKERFSPRVPTADLEHDATSTWTHNWKDDLAAFIDHDTEWWMKYLFFSIWVYRVIIVVLVILLLAE